MNHLHNAIRKCGYEYRYTWSGCLIPREILALKDFGCHFHEDDIKIAVDWKRRGVGNSRWVFFNIDKNSAMEKEFKEIKRGLHDTH